VAADEFAKIWKEDNGYGIAAVNWKLCGYHVQLRKSSPPSPHQVVHQFVIGSSKFTHASWMGMKRKDEPKRLYQPLLNPLIVAFRSVH
jgi:hypothetical protein